MAETFKVEDRAKEFKVVDLLVQTCGVYFGLPNTDAALQWQCTNFRRMNPWNTLQFSYNKSPSDELSMDLFSHVRWDGNTTVVEHKNKLALDALDKDVACKRWLK